MDQVLTQVELTRGILSQRAESSLTIHYLGFFSLMQGVVLALATYQLPDVLREWRAMGWRGWHKSRLPFWLAGMVSTILTFHANAVGTHYLMGVPSLLDTVLPSMLICFQFLLFATLQKHDRDPEWNPADVVHWYQAFALFALSAFLLVTNIMHRMDHVQAAAEVQSLFANYIAGQRNDIRGALATSVVFSLLALLHWAKPKWRPGIRVIAPFLAMAAMVPPILNNCRSGEALRAFLNAP